MAESNNRIKYAYLNYDEISTRIENGNLDAYDIVFTKDTHEQYFIKDDLSPFSVKSRIDCFDSIQSATEYINNNTNTYEGQIVAIADNELGVYHGYIVNKSNNNYVVMSLASSNTQIDYNSLLHVPIINKIGELGNPIIIDNLDAGVYSVSGEYKLFEKHQTVFSTSTNHLFFIGEDTNSNTKYIKEISSKNITTYTFDNGVLKKEDIVTETYLKDNGYITNDDFDVKIKALNLINKDEISDYVKTIMSEYLNENLGSIVDDKIDKKIESMVATESDIKELFT